MHGAAGAAPLHLRRRVGRYQVRDAQGLGRRPPLTATGVVRRKREPACSVVSRLVPDATVVLTGRIATYNPDRHALVIPEDGDHTRCPGPHYGRRPTRPKSSAVGSASMAIARRRLALGPQIIPCRCRSPYGKDP